MAEPLLLGEDDLGDCDVCGHVVFAGDDVLSRTLMHHDCAVRLVGLTVTDPLE